MARSPGGGGRAVGVHLRRWLFGAAAVGAVAVGAAGAQAAGGALDPSFGRGGKVVTDLGGIEWASAAVIQADGKIVVAGTSDATGGRDFALVRYTTGGRLDASFGHGGKVVTDLGSDDDEPSAVALQADGRIVAAGYTATKDGGNDFALVRYTSGGGLDAGFGSGGKVVTDLGGRVDILFDVALQADGKIAAAGYSNAHGSYDIALVRYTSSGRLDASFGSGGKVVTDLATGSDDGASAIAVQKDGKIVVAGNTNPSLTLTRAAVVRYSPTGKLDASFGRGGKVVTDLGGADYYADVAVQADGKIVAAGSGFELVRYTTGGKLDTSFGSGGRAKAGGGWAVALAIQKDGRIVVGGSSDASGGGDFALVRYTTSGRRDASFGSRGKVVTNFGRSDLASAVAFQKDGKIVAAGTSGDDDLRIEGDFALVRYMK